MLLDHALEEPPRFLSGDLDLISVTIGIVGDDENRLEAAVEAAVKD
jgi:hypothetical protein